MNISCCTVRSRQGQSGGVITGTQWELPAVSCVSVIWLRSSCSQGVCAAQHSPGGQAVRAA